VTAPLISMDDALRAERRAKRESAAVARPQSNDIVTEDSAATAFAEEYGGHLRYCFDTGSWFVWDGVRWRQNKTKMAFQFARQLARKLAAEAPQKVRYTASKAAFAASVERYAQSDPVFAVTADCWDQDPLLLGTPAGVVDLKTGELLVADQSLGITKSTSVIPDRWASCPRWLGFLNDATRGDADLIRFLQQWCGYCLTGLVNEHALVFVHGAGGNGKSLFLNVVGHVLGDYATVSAMETFTASRNDRHSTEIAMLRGARLVTASETEEGRAWAEARIKQLTGGEPITARFMRQDNFTYQPTFKLLIVGNHAPVLRNVDDAAKRRFNIVPFVHKPEKPDRELEQKLQAEAPGILRWMIEGCLDWQARGLVRPPVVNAATESYFSDQDLFSQWLAEECELVPSTYKSETSKDLFSSWRSYAMAAGDDPGSSRSFAERLLRTGAQKKKGAQGRREFVGIVLIAKEAERMALRAGGACGG